MITTAPKSLIHYCSFGGMKKQEGLAKVFVPSHYLSCLNSKLRKSHIWGSNYYTDSSDIVTSRLKVDEFPHKYDLIVILELSAKPPNSACKISFNNGISSRKIPETYGGLYMKIMQVFRTSKPTTTSLKQSHLTLIGNMEGQLAYKYSFHIIFDPKVGVHDKFIEKLSIHNLILETDKERFSIHLLPKSFNNLCLSQITDQQGKIIFSDLSLDELQWDVNGISVRGLELHLKCIFWQ